MFFWDLGTNAPAIYATNPAADTDLVKAAFLYINMVGGF